MAVCPVLRMTRLVNYHQWLVLFTLFSTCSGKQLVNCTNEETMLACSATTGCVLSVQNASFGHTEPSASTVDCPRNVDSGDCTTNATFVWRLCQGQRQCQFRVPEARPGGKCTTVSTYIEINYSCTCVGCRALPALPSGGLMYTSPYLTPGTIAEFTCQAGYELVGSQTRTCGIGGAWSGMQPACTISEKLCPSSAFPVRPFGTQCFEFVSSVATRDDAHADCVSRNGTLLYDEGGSTRAFIEWQLNLQDVYNYIWLDRRDEPSDSETKQGDNSTRSPNRTKGGSCQELFREDVGSATWRLRNTTCSFKNRYVCVHDSDPSLVKEKEAILKSHRTRAGIGVGVSLGLVLILICFFCIVCRDRKPDEDTYSSVEEGKDNNDVIKTNTDDVDQDIYDDTISPPAVPEHTLKYAQVSKGRKTEHGQPNYDEVYTTMKDPPTPRYTSPNHNAYENVTVHNLVGSLKRKLSHPFRRVVGDNSSRVGPGTKRQKPMPAPKPAIRRSALFRPSAVATLPAATKDSQAPETAERSKTLPPVVSREDSVTKDTTKLTDDKTRGSIEIVENEIYDADDNPEMLTEL